MNKQDYILKGARAFLSGKHIACYGQSHLWQHRAMKEGDKLARRVLFGTESPGYDVIKGFHFGMQCDLTTVQDKIETQMIKIKEAMGNE